MATAVRLRAARSRSAQWRAARICLPAGRPELRLRARHKHRRSATSHTHQHSPPDTRSQRLFTPLPPPPAPALSTKRPAGCAAAASAGAVGGVRQLDAGLARLGRLPRRRQPPPRPRPLSACPVPGPRRAGRGGGVGCRCMSRAVSRGPGRGCFRPRRDGRRPLRPAAARAQRRLPRSEMMGGGRRRATAAEGRRRFNFNNSVRAGFARHGPGGLAGCGVRSSARRGPASERREPGAAMLLDSPDTDVRACRGVAAAIALDPRRCDHVAWRYAL